MCFSRDSTKVSFGTNQVISSTSSQSLKILIAGIHITQNSFGISEFSSTFIFQIFAFHSKSFATSSIIGQSIWHGPHQGAQKSTKDTPVFVSSAKFASVKIKAIFKKLFNIKLNK